MLTHVGLKHRRNIIRVLWEDTERNGGLWILQMRLKMSVLLGIMNIEVVRRLVKNDEDAR